LGRRKFKFVQIKSQVLFKREIITKMGVGRLIIFFSRTTGSIRLGINHPGGRGFKFLQMKGILPFSKGR
jgi:hypothetical protein